MQICDAPLVIWENKLANYDFFSPDIPLTSTMKWPKLKRTNQHVESVSSQPCRLKFKNQGNGGHIL